MKTTIVFPQPDSAALNTSLLLSPPPSPQLATEREICTQLRVSKRNLYCWRKAGLIPYIKIGRAVRFRLSDVRQALETMTVRNSNA